MSSLPDPSGLKQRIYDALDGIWMLVMASTPVVLFLLTHLLCTVVLIGLTKGAPSYWPNDLHKAINVDIGQPCGGWTRVSAFMEQRGADGLCSIVGFASYITRNAQAVARYEAEQEGKNSPYEVYFHWFALPILGFALGLACVAVADGYRKEPA